MFLFFPSANIFLVLSTCFSVLHPISRLLTSSALAYLISLTCALITFVIFFTPPSDPDLGFFALSSLPHYLFLPGNPYPVSFPNCFHSLVTVFASSLLSMMQQLTSRGYQTYTHHRSILTHSTPYRQSNPLSTNQCPNMLIWSKQSQ